MNTIGSLIKKLGLRRTKVQLQEMLGKVDDDGSGEISFEEFCEMLGLKIQSPEDLEDIEIGYDKPYGTVMFSQQEERFFYKEGDIDDLILIAKAKEQERRAEEAAAARKTMFKKAFEDFDEDNSGEIDAFELALLVKELGLNKSEEELRILMGEVDEDNSGQVGFDEFVDMVEKMLREDNDGQMMAVMDGSKKAEIELKKQRERDSGALIMWN
jgi:Ca2+-binding EF-hand superfamily protein